jgi:hypothetical protein
VSDRAAPSVADIETIGADPRSVLRNLRITQAYHELATATAAALGPGSGPNWCAFATWASRQAGQSIRADDLGRKVEDAFAGSDVVRSVVGRLRDLRRSVGRALDADDVLIALRHAFAPVLAVTRVADAVARGNKKVFDEIAAEFARFVSVLDAGADEAAVARFLGRLRPGSPPDGQDLLAAAFRDYRRARGLTDPKARAERTLLANARIGMHEQTRLQPEIVEALNAPIADPGLVARELLTRLFAGRHLPIPVANDVLVELVSRLLEPTRAIVRRVVTEELMTFTLPDGRALRLGTDLTGSFPPRLTTLEDPEVRAFVKAIDPTPDSLVGSGARDWADLPDRMHMILDLFRRQHDNAGLFGPPFTPDQLGLIARGLTPDGRL